MKQSLRLRKSGVRIGECANEMLGQTQDIADQTWIHKLCSRSMCICSSKVEKIHGVLGVHVDDVIGARKETFDRIMTAVRKEFDFGAWDVGNFRFKGRQIPQMPSGEIVFDMEQYKHELEQIEVSSKADKTKPERLLNSKEHTQFRGGVGSLGWYVRIIAVHSYHFSWQNCVENKRHRQFNIC